MKSIVSVSWLSKNVNNPNLVILDASPESNASNLEVQFPGIQIKGARYFDFKKIIVNKESDLPNMLPSTELFEQEVRKLGVNSNSKIVVYDNLGVYASPRVWWMFKIMGHNSVAVLDGGLTEWKNHNFKCESIQQFKVAKGNFQATFHPELIRSSQQILENISSKNEVVIDARSKNRFEGAVPETRENLKRGHIPMSINLPFLEALKEGKFLSKEEILQKCSGFLLENKPMVFTCGSGITACILLLAANKIGYNNTSIYDGSWTEWGQLENVPIEK